MNKFNQLIIGTFKYEKLLSWMNEVNNNNSTRKQFALNGMT